jgi:serine/threonine-protein kinase RsbW
MRLCCDVEVSDHLIRELELAVQEALVNVMAHAFEADIVRTIDLTLSCQRARLRVEISYRGLAFDEAAVPPPSFDGSRDHGFGLFIMKQLMDKVEHGRREDGQRFIRLEKKLNERVER